MKVKIAVIIFVILNAIALKAINIDSTKHEITFNFNKRVVKSLDDFTKKTGPFSANYIISSSIFYNRNIYAKKYSITLLTGLNYRFINIGYKTSTNVLHAKQDINVSNYLLGLNLGICVERKILKYKNLRLFIGAGVNATGIFYSPQKTVSLTYDIPNATDKDSVVIDFKRNKHIYPYPFFQLKFKHKINKRVFLYGLRYNVGTDFSVKTFVEYKIGYTRPSPIGFYRYKGNFRDGKDQLEFFLGIAF